jgi:ribonucleotide monophosphatase NagD (HAD superfamily)
MLHRAVLVLTGETTEEDVAKAEAKDRPDYTVASLLDVHNAMFA